MLTIASLSPNMALSLYVTINNAFGRVYRRFQRLEQRIKRIEEYPSRRARNEEQPGTQLPPRATRHQARQTIGHSPMPHIKITIPAEREPRRREQG